ncbi:ExbD/TolR family protein [Seonamhaeicola aphaedonensis]|uniref:Biopolymer transport protein ExbD n=1 Tax=Seonamhaeicola aphaedonensis TaxID=1461338 RepID=A0A3D9HIU7_9FLAO|nr:biopolymer transporter ExbD [Seonamhaeicola aphaedonensis]RED49355.1 biopolymer transport protein ExbD [Seonamhaeicola aphaedonensis]
MRHSKFRPEINAGSMADIAFLLLIFFLVTATISTEEGINRMLQKECPQGVDCTPPINKRNILKVMINDKDQIMVEGNTIIKLEDLKDIAKDFLDNNGDGSCNYCNGKKDITSSDNPKEAVISLQNSKLTSYRQYIAVQNELTRAYYELRKSYANNIFHKSVDDLTKKEFKQVREAYPFILSEAETK